MLRSQQLVVASLGVPVIRIPSSGMENTITQGEEIIVDQQCYRQGAPSAEDILVFKKDNTFFLKRLIAKGGDTISGKDGLVFVDGTELREPYIKHLGLASPELDNFGPVQVPVGKMFVMGDNRDVSLDSRTPDFGLVDERTVVGKALYIVGPTTGRIGRELR